jgi:AcrR family transcriptional regulator
MTHDPEQRQRRTRVDGERTRRHILDTAVRLATVEGLDGLSIGTLAQATNLSKGGVYAHFDSKEQLQLATVDNARALFIDVVVAPALAGRGLERLRALCESFLVYVENRTLPGGCFFAAAAAELGGRPGPLRERVAANQKDWIGVLTDAANEAVGRGELRADADVATLVFELNALVIAANTAFILHDDRAVLTQARRAIERVVLAVAASQPGSTSTAPLGEGDA